MNANEKRNALHAHGRSSGATPPTVLVAGSGNWTPTRAGAGLFDVTFDANSLIDPLERVVIVTAKVTSLTAGVPTASDTDAVFRVSIESDVSGATDAAFDFLVFRASF